MHNAYTYDTHTHASVSHGFGPFAAVPPCHRADARGTGIENTHFHSPLPFSLSVLCWDCCVLTLWVPRLGRRQIRIDTDLLFLNAVKQKVNQIGYKKLSKQTYLHRNIGPTSRWGHPLFPETRKQSLLSKFKNYSDPKFFMRDKPDLIMIDGRFRVATLLRMYDFLKSYSGWQVLFDDFFSREDYKIVSKFFLIDERIGRLAVIKNVVSCNPDELNDAIKKYILNPY